MPTCETLVYEGVIERFTGDWSSGGNGCVSIANLYTDASSEEKLAAATFKIPAHEDDSGLNSNSANDRRCLM